MGCLGGDDGGYGNPGPSMYRVDPSGAVVLLSSSHAAKAVLSKDTDRERQRIEDGCRRGSVAFLGNWDPLRQRKDGIRNQLEGTQFTSEGSLQNVLVDVARQTYVDETSIINEGRSADERSLNQPVLFASFTRDRGLRTSRIM